MKSLSLRLREADQMLISMRSQEVHQRLIDFLRKGADAEGYVQLGMSQSGIAEILGCTRETVNRAIADLIKKGELMRESKRLLRFPPV